MTYAPPRFMTSLDEAVSGAWRAFDHAAILPSRVSPAMPILFFGDLHEYQRSMLRVVTVGLNPSWHEFPTDAAFRRFPHTNAPIMRQQVHYLRALSEYFRTCPYHDWFASFDLMLNGIGASYYATHSSTALHTDICSPVATKPTWRKLDRSSRETLGEDGTPVWNGLLSFLKPQIVVLSVARSHLLRIQFAAINEWEVIHTFRRTKSGDTRKRPVKISARWYCVGGGPCLFVFVPAAQKPLGSLSNAQKREAGTIALEAFRSGL